MENLWKGFTNAVDFYGLIMVSYSTHLIDKPLYKRLTKIRKLRNKIAHNLTYSEPEIFVTRKEVKESIEEGIKILEELQNVEKDIVFGRK